MARLIDADALIEDIDKEIDIEKKVFLSSVYCAGMRNVIRLVKRLPTVEPLKHGHWIFKGNGNADCSCCGYRSSRVYDDDNADRYCRHCGARMDGDAND